MQDMLWLAQHENKSPLLLWLLLQARAAAGAATFSWTLQ